jgi:hypothetical protein
MTMSLIDHLLPAVPGGRLAYRTVMKMRRAGLDACVFIP